MEVWYFFVKRRGRDSRGYVLLAYLLDLSIWIILYLSRGKINSTFPPCNWLLRGSCLELYSYCLFRGHGIVFFFLPRLFSQGSGQGCVCVWGSAQDHSLGWKVEVKKKTIWRLRLKKRRSEDWGLNIGIQFQANSRNSQV